MPTRPLSILTFLGLILTAVISPVNASVIFTSNLDGAQEVPPVATTATGFATGELGGGPGAFVFTYEITYSGLGSVIAPIAGTGGHIHLGALGTNGPIVHVLDQIAFNYTGTTTGTILGEWRFDDPSLGLTDSLAQSLLDGDLYINLHTQNFPAGEIRGQLRAVPIPPTLALIGLCLAVIGYQRGKRN